MYNYIAPNGFCKNAIFGIYIQIFKNNWSGRVVGRVNEKLCTSITIELTDPKNKYNCETIYKELFAGDLRTR